MAPIYRRKAVARRIGGTLKLNDLTSPLLLAENDIGSSTLDIASSNDYHSGRDTRKDKGKDNIKARAVPFIGS